MADARSPDDAGLDADAHALVGLLQDEVTATGAVGPDARARAVYAELRRLARRHRARWNGNDTLNTTALVHEAYLRIADGAFETHAHALAVASRAMRQVLINYARDQSALKRGGGARPVSLDDAPPGALLAPAEADDVLGLDDALGRLAAFDPAAARVVELRFFGGLTSTEAAGALGVSPSTVARLWRRARAWLRGELGAVPTNPTLGDDER